MTSCGWRQPRDLKAGLPCHPVFLGRKGTLEFLADPTYVLQQSKATLLFSSTKLSRTQWRRVYFVWGGVLRGSAAVFCLELCVPTFSPPRGVSGLPGPEGRAASTDQGLARGYSEDTLRHEVPTSLPRRCKAENATCFINNGFLSSHVEMIAF